MIQTLILGTVVLWLIISFPTISICAGILLVMFYILSEKDKENQDPEENSVISRAKRIYGKFVKDGVIDWEGYQQAEAEKQMKPGFRDDPAWQRSAARIRKYMAERRKANEMEEQKEQNQESGKESTPFWTKTR